MLDSVENHEKFKGCLYILLGPKGAPIVARHNWEFIREIWPALILSKPSEKQSIVNLMTSLNDAINRHFPTIYIKLEIFEKSIKSAENMVTACKEINLDDFKTHMCNSLERINKESTNNMNTYTDILNTLLDAALQRNL